MVVLIIEGTSILNLNYVCIDKQVHYSHAFACFYVLHLTTDITFITIPMLCQGETKA